MAREVRAFGSKSSPLSSDATIEETVADWDNKSLVIFNIGFIAFIIIFWTGIKCA
jgi:hypothetical protein